MLTWPSTADPEKSNPMTVELMLQKLIREAQVSLLGELDLDSAYSWADTNWSLSQLAEYVFSSKALKSSLTEGINTKARRLGDFEKAAAVLFPATIAIWSVSQAQRLETGQELWTTADLSPNQINALPYKFEDSIRRFELETFEGKLSEQKRLSLARFHAIIPNYAIDEFVRVVRRCEEQLLSTIETLGVIARTQTLAISVKGLFDARTDIAIDIIDRSFRTIRTGELSGLPPRISRVLLSQIRKNRGNEGISRQQAPIISFDESIGELYFKGHSGWRFVDESGIEISNDSIPPKNITAINFNGSQSQILNLGDGYLLLSRNLDVLPFTNQLPRDGGLIWNQELIFDFTALATEPMPVFGWPGWNFALLKQIERLQLTLPDGRIRYLGKSKEIQLIGQPIPNVKTIDDFAIYSKSPRIAAGQNVTILSNVEQNSRKSTGEEEFLVLDPGHFDLTLYAGLGRSINVKGFLLPELSFSEIDFPLIENEKRAVEVSFADTFSGPKTIILDAGSSETKFSLTEKVSSRTIPISVSVPILEWSLLMNNREPQRFRRFSKLTTNDLRHVERLVIQDSSRDDVKLRIESKGELWIKTSPKARDNSLIFDLKFLQDSDKGEQLDLIIEIGKVVHKILSFSQVTQTPKTNKVILNDIRKLAEGWISVGGMTQQEWDTYQEEMRRHSREVMAAYRQRRDRRK